MIYENYKVNKLIWLVVKQDETISYVQFNVVLTQIEHILVFFLQTGYPHMQLQDISVFI
jgi:hypothetical protein